MFQLTKQIAVLAHVNSRLEKHGEENVPAADLTFHANVSNVFLDTMAPGLRTALYRRDGEEPGETRDIIEEETGDPMTLRFPQLDALKIKGKIEDVKLVLHGKNKSDNTELACDIGAIRVQCMDGGTVGLEFQAKMLIEPEHSAHFTALLGKEVKISVTPPETPEEPPIE